MGGLLAAWEYWPPLLGYRADRALAGARDQVRKYLTGTQSLDTSARRLATRLQDWQRLTERARPAPPLEPGTLVATTFNLTPAGFASDDPRIDDLYFRAMMLSVPADASPAFKEAVARQLDSVAAAARAKRRR
jgi:hypothetical protein